MTCNLRQLSLRILSRTIAVYRSRFPLFALLGLGAGCRLAPTEGNLAVQGGLPNPVPIINENYRVRLDWPGQGWQLLDASLSGPDLCAYDGEQSLSGCVSVAHAPPASLGAYVSDWLNRVSYLNRSTIRREKADYQQQPAEFFEADGTYSREPLHIAGVVFYYQNHVYRVVVRGPLDKFDRTRCQRFIESVHLVPGKVQDPGIERAGQPKSGLGFRVKNGVYENAIKDFRIAIDSSWSLVVGNALHEFNPDADIVLIRENPEVSLAVRVEPTQRGSSVLSPRQENHRQNLQVGFLKDRPSLRIEGATYSGRLGRSGNGNMIAYYNYPVGDKSVELTAGFSELYRTASLPLVEQVASSIALVAKTDRLAFEQSFAGDTLSEHRVGGDYSLENGCFREFALGLGWCQPEGFWNFTLGDEARASHDGAVLRVSNLNNGLSLNLFFRSPTEHATTLVESLAAEYRLDAHKPVKIGSFTQVAAQPRDTRKPNAQSFLYSMARGTDEIAALITCTEAYSNCREASEELARGLVLKDFGKAVEYTDHGLVDRRLGIAQQLPPAYRARSREELPVEGGQQATWESPDASVILLTALNGDSSDVAANFSESVVRATRATVPVALLRQRKTTTLRVGEQQADCQSFVGLNYRFDTVLLRHNRVLLAWLVASRSAGRLQEVLAGLRFIQ